MIVEIRRARLSDVDAIVEIIEIAFQEDVDEGRLQSHLALSNNIIHVAVTHDKVVGLAENFITISLDLQTRLELDLLAVHPDVCGQGIGKMLVSHSVSLAKAFGVNQIRALVALDNYAMHGVCNHHGFRQGENVMGLYVMPTDEIQYAKQVSTLAHFIRVHTLTYSGIWIEGQVTHDSLTMANTIAGDYRLDILGCVYPKAENLGTELLKFTGFDYIDAYRHWTLNLRNGLS